MKNIYFFVLALFSAAFVNAQDNILDARTNFNIGDMVTITGIVTSTDDFGSIRYIQDETAGFAIYPGADWGTFATPELGDEITVTGEITEFNQLLEVGPNLTNVVVNSTGNAVPEPLLITPNEVGEDDEAELVKIVGCQFQDGGASIVGNSTYNFTAGGQSGTIYVRTSNSLVGTVLPAGLVDLTAIVSQFDFSDPTDGYQLLPRNAGDFVQESSINIASAISVSEINQNGFKINWLTDTEGTSLVTCATLADMSDGFEVSGADNTTDHEVVLDNLQPGTIYYVIAESSNGTDVAESLVNVFATESTSSGDIKVFFNAPVDASVATDEIAQNLGSALNDSIAAFISTAQSTLEIAVYNFDDNVIAQAINGAQENGVQVRYIAQGTNLNNGLFTLNENIPVFEREDDEGSGMHNKIVIVDADVPERAAVLTGATNWTQGQLNFDPNNVVIIQDQSIARTYRLEFNEMWGSDGPMPDAANSKFGAAKTNNTPHEFVVNGQRMEVYFSPTDNTTAAIETALRSAVVDVEFSLLAFTRDDLAAALIDVNSGFFTTVRGMIEQENGTGTEFTNLQENGIEVYSHAGITGILHHKYCIIDQSQPAGDPKVITGSHNWSSTAENVNDENTVIIHDARVANLFYQEWNALFLDLDIEEVSAFENGLTIYPNPATDYIQIDFETTTSGLVSIFSLEGKIVFQQNMTNKSISKIDISDLESGMYRVQFAGANGIQSGAFVK